MGTDTSEQRYRISITQTLSIMLPNPVIMRNQSPQNPYYYTKR
jgi:hypothetical protein